MAKPHTFVVLPGGVSGRWRSMDLSRLDSTLGGTWIENNLETQLRVDTYR